jgi:hypothetical protein
MWAVMTFKLEKNNSEMRRRRGTQALDNKNPSCGLRKMIIDFDDPYYQGLSDVIRQPRKYDYYYCAGKYRKK